MKVLVCGGRKYDDWPCVRTALDKAHKENPISVVIHGACCDFEHRLRGADGLAERWAIENEVPYYGVPAKWTKYGKPAGHKRNAWMADNTKPDLVIAFPGGSGTNGMVDEAKKRGIDVWRPI